MRHRLSWFCLALLASWIPAEAVAQGIPAQAVRAMRMRNGVHPMAASDGRVGMTAKVPPGIDPRAWGLVPVAPGLGVVRLSPSDIETFEKLHPEPRLTWWPPLHPTLDKAVPISGVPAFQQATELKGAGVVIGIIDTGLDLKHADLRTAVGKTRVAWLIDMSRKPNGRHKELEDAYGCSGETSACAVLDSADIEETLGTQTSSDAPRDDLGHGTHVASIAAGNGLASNTSTVYAGVAPEAVLIGARVTRAGGDISDTDVLLATRFVFDRAEALGLPAVVNMSLGADFGPHDGTSPLETGLASLVGPQHPGRAIVVAAGNSGVLYLAGEDTLGVHTDAHVVPGATTRVTMRAPNLTGTVKGSAYVWIGWRAGESISVGMAGPNGETWVSPVAPGHTDAWDSADGKLTVQVINDLAYDGSPLTPDSHGAVLVFDGEWAPNSEHDLLLEGDGTADLWIQGTGEAASGEGGTGELFLRAIKQGTVNVPATSPGLIAVGATLNRHQWKDADGNSMKLSSFGSMRPPIDDSIAYFSGAGPTRTGVMKPEISAPGAFVAAAMSRNADPATNPQSMFATSSSECPSGSQHCLVVDAAHAIAAGTSMAAPMVAGAAALLLSLQPQLTQPEIVALLQAGARYPTGTIAYPYQMGAGALDIEGSRLALEAMGRPLLRDPDPSKSWMVLGAGYARPGRQNRIEGTLETRFSDGTIADGFDASQLQLLTHDAEVLEPLARVAPGLWRFAVAAPEGSGGRTMTVETRFAGALLGEKRALAIGPDVFIAREGFTAHGGCSVSSSSSGAGWWMLLVAALLRLRKTSK